MAEGLLRDLLKKKGWNDFQVLSAGVSAVGGMGPTLETVEVMEKEGIDVSNHIGTPVTPEILEHADAIFCMEMFHRDWIVSLVPSVESKTHLLKIFQTERSVKDPNIGDPIGRPKEVYESCFLTIKESVERVVRWLEKAPAP